MRLAPRNDDRNSSRRPGDSSTVLQKHLVQLYNEGEHTSTELAELMQVGRSTVYRTLARAKAQAIAAAGEA